MFIEINYQIYFIIKFLQKNMLTKLFIYADFICTDNSHCNGHGSCDDDGQCDCDSDWNSLVDCSGNMSSLSLNIYVIRGCSLTMWPKEDGYVVHNVKIFLAETFWQSQRYSKT
jgi:hypothetical protein